MLLKAEAFVALTLAAIMMRLSPSRWDRLLQCIPQRTGRRGRSQSPSLLVNAVDSASTLFPARVLCLQRSLAIVMLCRRRGVLAHAVLGTRPRPFVAHAWVEHNSAVLGDDADRIGRWYTVVSRFG